MNRLCHQAAMCTLLTGCLSQAAPVPAVRWFDPTPAAITEPLLQSGVRVAAAAFVRQEFVVRTGERELAIDDLHRWIAPPEQLLARVLGAGAGGARTGDEIAVLVTRFELDTTHAPRAVIALQIEVGSVPVAVTVDAEATGALPEQLAAAMAQALLRAAAAVATAAAPATAAARR